MANAVQLSNVNPTLLPPDVVAPIFLKTQESSAVMNLARKVPLAVNVQTAIPIPMDVPSAGWVVEGGRKPVSTGNVGVKLMTGKKVAVLIPVSQEVVMTNSAGLYAQLQQDLPTAISRAFDHAAIHGLDLASGGPGPFGEYLKMTPNSQLLGATAQNAGGIYADLVKGEQLVVNSAGYDFTGFAADPRLKPQMKLATDTQGRPLFAEVPGLGISGIGSELDGYPAFYNTGVSGRYYRQNNLGTNEVDTVTINGAPTGGTFTLTILGQTTAPIAFNATAAVVQSAVQALSMVGTNATVTGNGPYVVTFGGTLGSQTVGITASGAGLTGGTTPSASVTVTTPGVTSDTGLRAVGGDWSQCAYGVGMDISIRVSNEASYVDGAGVTHSAFQENLVLLLAEAYYGFVVNTTQAFVVYHN